jgi:hypothetical protein
MVNKMAKVTTLVLDVWEQKVRNAGGSTQLEINNDMRTITSHVISHTTFGNDYKEGKQMFQQMEALVQIIAEIVTNPFFKNLDLGSFSLSFLFMKMQYFTLSHVCMFEWTSN